MGRLNGTHGPNGYIIVAPQYGGKMDFSRKPPLPGPAALPIIMPTPGNQGRVSFQLIFCNCCVVSLKAACTIALVVWRTGDKGDSTMTMLRQMSNRLANPLSIIDGELRSLLSSADK